jgi:hypothetical protein
LLVAPEVKHTFSDRTKSNPFSYACLPLQVPYILTVFADKGQHQGLPKAEAGEVKVMSKAAGGCQRLRFWFWLGFGLAVAWLWLGNRVLTRQGEGQQPAFQ